MAKACASFVLIIASVLCLLNACSTQSKAPASAGSASANATAGAGADLTAGTMRDAMPIAPLPAGAEGDLITYGRNILHDTPRFAGKYIAANMSCEACHLNGGTKAHAGSLMGIYAVFPQFNRRSKHFITLQDRLAECFLYSMNGTPPAYSSHEMIALTAYIAYLSRGATVGRGYPAQGFEDVRPSRAPSLTSGSKVYGQRCAACHGAGGGGVGIYPPLWGSKSFNDGAGMHRLTTMSAFVRYSMPFGSLPNSLSAQDAYNVSAFVLSHSRPKFSNGRLITFTAQRASTF